ncbi:DNA-binding MarR family transcriptional regulator [Catenulispora sp. EB89]|uniref:MarR family winged helix-turn-helix transcriptional regulator n=1 Tax=Catenulispora sp. EB89 TaxID=3156257 RepID=UPI0035192142
MTAEPKWLDTREEHAWRTFLHTHHELMLRLQRHMLADSGLIPAEYEVLVVLSQHPDGVMSAQELGSQLRWEKSRLSHQVRRMQDQGLVARDPNPADARSCLVRLEPKGRRTIEEAAPWHVQHVRQDFIDLITPEELETLIAVNERVLGHLAGRAGSEDPFQGNGKQATGK